MFAAILSVRGGTRARLLDDLVACRRRLLRMTHQVSERVPAEPVMQKLLLASLHLMCFVITVGEKYPLSLLKFLTMIIFRAHVAHQGRMLPT